MGGAPQRWWSNTFLILAVTITLFLATNTLVHNVFGSFFTKDTEYLKMVIAACVAPLVMLVLFFTTTLGAGVKASFGCGPKRQKSEL